MSDNPEKRRRASPTAASLTTAGVNGQIAARLKALYSTVEQEPIPDIFLDLLEKLDTVEKARSPKNDTAG